MDGLTCARVSHDVPRDVRVSYANGVHSIVWVADSLQTTSRTLCTYEMNAYVSKSSNTKCTTKVVAYVRACAAANGPAAAWFY